MAYAREAAAISPRFKVFPSTEAVLLEARSGAFAGCISATANLNADLCARAWRGGDAAALDAAVTIRKLFDGKQLVSGVKALLAHIHGDAAWATGAAAAEPVRGRRPGIGGGRLRRRPRQAGGLKPVNSRGRPTVLTLPGRPTISGARWRRGARRRSRFTISTRMR